jgi:hypothetical protein
MAADLARAVAQGRSDYFDCATGLAVSAPADTRYHSARQPLSTIAWRVADAAARFAALVDSGQRVHAGAGAPGCIGAVLWAALTGFTAVAAIAFFAIWSVLSNMFCALLIFAMGPFRMGDCVEVLESATKPGVRGRVVAINLFYTTLEDLSGDAPGAWVQIPNSLFFQKAVRRWRNGELPSPRNTEV